MSFWLDVAAFGLKALLIVIAVVAIVGLIAALRGGEKPEGPRLKVRSLDDRYDDYAEALADETMDKKARKARAKALKAADKAVRAAPQKKRVFVLNFKGDLGAHAVEHLRAEIDALLTTAKPGEDEVALRLESPGGTVTGYGLAAAQILRLRDKGLKTTACVDQVAASGGYMMACAADRIVAAPFAMVGSIGVVAQIPNVNKLLRKYDVDFEEITAGEHKRSVSIFGEITPAGREHFREKIDATHIAFKAFVARCRPKLDVSKVGDGDVWFGDEALSLGLIDEIGTSDDYLFRARADARIFEVTMMERPDFIRRLLGRFGMTSWPGTLGDVLRL